MQDPTRKPIRWRKHAIVIAAFFALGLVANTAVAWGIAGMILNWQGRCVTVKLTEYDGAAHFGDRYISVRRFDMLTFSRIDVHSSRSIRWLDLEHQSAIQAGSEDALSLVPGWAGWDIESVKHDAEPVLLQPAAARTLSLTHDAPEVVWRMFMSTGFPLPSVRWTAKSMKFGTSSQGMHAFHADPINAGSVVFTTHPPFVSIGGEGYPLRPIWRGAIINSVFYGAILFGFWRAVVALRRRCRRRRNQCSACGYSLAGLISPACPECDQSRPLAVGEGDGEPVGAAG